MKRGKSIREKDEVVFFPTAARWDERNQAWDVSIDGAVFDPCKVKMRKKLMIRLLRRFMNVSADHLDCDLFRERIRPFTANALKGREVRVRFGSHEIELEKRTKRNGHFTSSFYLDPDQVDSLVEEGAVTNRVLNYELVLDDRDERVFCGRVHLLLPQGKSVISDVDDTIKHTQVGNASELLKNTFLREFREIEGMPQLFQKWNSGGIDFHFVSASPWQLISPLHQFLQAKQFPEGTFNLRTFRWRDQVLRRVLSDRRVGKAKIIRKFIQRFPERSYVLIGDSAERDPELYAHLAEKYQKQIKAIYIRQAPGFEMTNFRVSQIQSQVDRTEFVTYQSSDELPVSSPF